MSFYIAQATSKKASRHASSVLSQLIWPLHCQVSLSYMLSIWPARYHSVYMSHTVLIVLTLPGWLYRLTLLRLRARELSDMLMVCRCNSYGPCIARWAFSSIWPANIIQPTRCLMVGYRLILLLYCTAVSFPTSSWYVAATHMTSSGYEQGLEIYGSLDLAP